MARIIGIDYGAKRVGIAVSDDGRTFAFAKVVLENNDKLVSALVRIAEEEGADMFVIGESDNPIGGANTIMRRIAFFAEALKIASGYPVERVSEAYSSAEARRAIEDKAKSRKTADIRVDSAAAAIILQTYLDRKK